MPRSLPILTAVALLLGAGGPAATAQPLTLLPGFALGWSRPGQDATLAFHLDLPAGGPPPLTEVRVGHRALLVTAFRLSLDTAQLWVTVHADAPGVYEVPWLELTPRLGPPLRLDAGASQIVAIPDGAAPLRLRHAAIGDGAGLYLAAAVANDGDAPVRLRALRYAPHPLAGGVVLVAHGPVADFDRWLEAVLERTGDAFEAYLREAPLRRRHAAPPLHPADLAFATDGLGHGSRWTSPEDLALTVPPGEAVFYAITPAAFRGYVDDLAITAYPVLAFESDGACCVLQGDGAVLEHRP